MIGITHEEQFARLNMASTDAVIRLADDEVFRHVDASIADAPRDLVRAMYDDAVGWQMIHFENSNGDEVVTIEDIARRVGQAFVVLGGYELKDAPATLER